MTANTTTISRTALYTEVWSQPMVRLAAKYGISDVGLDKICRKQRIPRPGRGYWVKLEFGHKPRRTPLPEPNDDRVIQIRRYRAGKPVENPATAKQEQAELAGSAVESRCIYVPERLSAPHPLITSTRRALEEEKGEGFRWYGRRLTHKKLDICVPDKLLPRALRIMNALLKFLEQSSYPVEVRDSEYGSHITIVRIMGEPIQFALSASSLDCLRLSINQRTFGLREHWRDGKKQRLEQILASFVAGLIQVAARERDMRLKREQEERIRQEQARRIQALIDAYQAEQRRVAALRKDAAAWRETQCLRAYVEAVRQQKMQAHQQTNPGNDLEKWITWALRQADRLDPLVDSPPSILDTPPPVLPRNWQAAYG